MMEDLDELDTKTIHYFDGRIVRKDLMNGIDALSYVKGTGHVHLIHCQNHSPVFCYYSGIVPPIN